jgi:hypothetical protein
MLVPGVIMGRTRPLLIALPHPAEFRTRKGSEATALRRGRWKALCCTDQRCGRAEPNPYVGLCDANIGRASEIEHAIQHVSCDGHFGHLPPVRLRSQPVTNDAFPSRDEI